MMSRVGKPVVIGRPGARGVIAGVSEMFVHDYGRVFALGNKGSFI